jgi:hypothetical protein
MPKCGVKRSELVAAVDHADAVLAQVFLGGAAP